MLLKKIKLSCMILGFLFVIIVYKVLRQPSGYLLSIVSQSTFRNFLHYEWDISDTQNGTANAVLSVEDEALTIRISGNGRMVDFISAGNPKAITFDILYTEPSIYGEEDDIALGAAEAKSKKVIQTFFYSAEDYGITLMPVKPINDNAALLGNITSAKDSDDIIRRTRLFDTFNDTSSSVL